VLQDLSNETIMLPCRSGRGAARLARLHGVQEVGGSNPLAPTNEDSSNGVFSLTAEIEAFPYGDALSKYSHLNREILGGSSIADAA
jgi:hypothetical protein